MYFEKIFFGFNHEISHHILAPFLSEAVEASQCHFFGNWLMNETQMSKTPEATRHHNLIKLLILLPLRADLLGILQYETPVDTATVFNVHLFQDVVHLFLISKD